eukprot:g10871.t1
MASNLICYARSLEWALSKLPPSSLRLTVDLNTPLERWLGISATCGMLISGSIFVSFVTNTMADVARERSQHGRTGGQHADGWCVNQAVFELYHLPGDIIFDTTSKTRGMYFIASGFSVYFHWSDSPKHPRSACRGSGNIFSKLLGVQRGSDVPMTQTMLELGEYAAEPAVWVNTWRHQGHLQAMVQGRSLLVSTEDLFKVLQGYANALANSVVYARCFVKELNRRAQLCGQVTDLPLPLMKGGSEEDLIFQNRKGTERREKKALDFFEVLDQMQVLQYRLREAYEADVARPRTGAHLPRHIAFQTPLHSPGPSPGLQLQHLQQMSQLSQVHPSSPKGTIEDLIMQSQVSPQGTAEEVHVVCPPHALSSPALLALPPSGSPEEEGKSSLQALSSRALSSPAQQRPQPFKDSLESALQLREEWDLPEEKLKGLKRLQRRMSVGSMQTIKPQHQRQYLLKTEHLDAPCYLLQWITTIFWVFDVPATFFTATYVNDILCFRLPDIASAYLRGWFLFDMFMLVPDLIVLLAPEMADGPAGVFRMARARRVLRLFRFVQIVRLWKTLQSWLSTFETRLTFLRTQFGSVARPVFFMGLLMGVAVHVLGSLWFAAGDTPSGWVLEEATLVVHRSLEWALSKLPPSSLRLTVELNTPLERWLGVCATCLALVSGSVFVSFITNTMANVARERTNGKTAGSGAGEVPPCYANALATTVVYARCFVKELNRRAHLSGQVTDLPLAFMKPGVIELSPPSRYFLRCASLEEAPPVPEVEELEPTKSGGGAVDLEVDLDTSFPGLAHPLPPVIWAAPVRRRRRRMSRDLVTFNRTERDRQNKDAVERLCTDMGCSEPVARNFLKYKKFGIGPLADFGAERARRHREKQRDSTEDQEGGDILQKMRRVNDLEKRLREQKEQEEREEQEFLEDRP